MPSLPVKHEAALASLRVRDATSGWCFVARGTMLFAFHPKNMYVWRLFGIPIGSERIFPGGPKDTWYSPNLKLKAKACSSQSYQADWSPRDAHAAYQNLVELR